MADHFTFSIPPLLEDYISLHVCGLAFRDQGTTREYWRAKFVAGLHPDLARVARHTKDESNQELVNRLYEYVGRTNWRFRPVLNGGSALLSTGQQTLNHSLLKLKVRIYGKEFMALVDSGATHNFLSRTVTNYLRIRVKEGGGTVCFANGGK